MLTAGAASVRVHLLNRPIVLALLLVWVPVWAAPATAAPEPDVRLMLASGQQALVISGKDLVVEGELSGGWRRIVKGVARAAFRVSGSRIRLAGTGIRAIRYRITDRSGLVGWDGRRWRGALYLHRDRQGISLVDRTGLEAYLMGLVNGEISSGWPMEAVKAQVVAARTYALYRMSRSSGIYDLKTDTSDQVYAGVASEDAMAARAVKLTRGLALYYDGALVPAFYHSSCGGSTSDAYEVWGISHPSLTGTRCGYCDDAPRSSWEVSLPVPEVAKIIGKLFPGADGIMSLGVHRRTIDGRVTVLFTDTDGGRLLIDANDFRQAVGYVRLPSTRFKLRQDGGRIVFTGRGFGHGVGLCQWGGRGMAMTGANFERILLKYYHGAEIRRAYR